MADGTLMFAQNDRLSLFGRYCPLVPVAKSGTRIPTRAALLVALQELLLESEGRAVSVPRLVSRAGVAQGTFYNYFESLPAAVYAVGELLLAEHFRTVLRAIDGATNAAEVVARSDRQTLMLFAHRPDVGRLVFESGEAVDRLILVREARVQLAANLQWGVDSGVFSVGDVDVACSIHIGAMVGACLDVYRGRLSIDSAPELVARLLRDLGVSKRKAARLAGVEQDFQAWRALPLIAKGK